MTTTSAQLKLKTAVSLLHDVDDQLESVRAALRRSAETPSPESLMAGLAGAVKFRMGVNKEAGDMRRKLGQAVALAEEARSLDSSVTVRVDEETYFDPDQTVAVSYLDEGLVDLTLQNGRSAESWFNKSLALVDAPLTRALLVDAFLSQGEPLKASDECQVLVDRFPESEEAVHAMKTLPALRAIKPKKWSTALVLSILLGWLGADRFYLGYFGSGFLKLVTLGGIYVWWLIDIARIASNSMRDARGYRLQK